jgi:hypothetical protein
LATFFCNYWQYFGFAPKKFEKMWAPLHYACPKKHSLGARASAAKRGNGYVAGRWLHSGAPAGEALAA